MPALARARARSKRAVLSARLPHGRAQSESAAVGLWLPNAVFAALGAYLFERAARERTLDQLERLQSGLAALRDWLLGRLGAEAAP